MSRVAVVIVTYNSAGVIASCLDALPVGVPVVCVDNASSDDTCAVISRVRPDTRIIKSERNIGFGAAANIGFNAVQTEFALLLNPDAEIDQEGIDALLTCADENPDAMIVAPLLFFEDGGLQASYRLHSLVEANRKTKNIIPDSQFCAGYISGAVMLIRKSHLEQTGAFDENIFMFYEDDDLCHRARKAGFSCIVTPQSKVRHGRGKSSGDGNNISRIKNISIVWSRIYIVKKYKGALQAYMLALWLVSTYLLKTTVYKLLFNNRKAMRSWYRAVGALKFICGY